MIDIEQEKQSLLQADRDFSALSVKKGSRVAFDRFMADSAVMLRPNAEPFRGREAIRSLFPARSTGTLAWEPYFADIAAAGDLGYTLGAYTYTFTDTEGKERVGAGNYITIWKKQSDGTWKYVFDTGQEGPRKMPQDSGTP